MTFVRALLIVWMVDIFGRVHAFMPRLVVAFLFAMIWAFSPDPTKERVKEAIEEIREEWRREP